MVFITPFLGAVALLSGVASALPRPDSGINEPAVFAPNGTPITEGSKPTVVAKMGNNNYNNYNQPAYNQPVYNPPAKDVPKYEASTTTVMKHEATTTTMAMQHVTTTYKKEQHVMSTTTTTSQHAVTTAPSYGSGGYGSGSSNWNNNGYNDCVQQCVASFGQSTTVSYKATTTEGSSGGSGATHTVIVAPTQGVLRYIPFAVNASVGDTIKFMWGANNHTVTKSSSLLPCNKTADALFASGTQNKDFVFTQVVNDTSPTFFYCATPTHCQKGMFGIINPPNALAGAPSSVGSMMPALAANNSDVAAYKTYSEQKTAGNADAAKWGSNIDMGSLPEWAHPYVAENVMYTRTFLAANSEVIKDNGAIDLSATGNTPLLIPQDLSEALNGNTPPPPAPAPVDTTTKDVPTPSPTSLGNLGNQTSGALSVVASSKVLVSIVAALATFLML